MKGWKVFRNEAFIFFIKLFLLMGEVRDGTKARFSVFHRNWLVSLEREGFMTRKKGRGICKRGRQEEGYMPVCPQSHFLFRREPLV